MSTRNFSEPWEDSDIVFIVEGEEFHAHYTILKLQSPVFTTLFQEGKFQEGKSKKVQLPGKGKDAFQLFLRLMYPFNNYDPNILNIGRNIIGKVLSYCHEYEVYSVKDIIDLILCVKYSTGYHGKALLLGDLKLCDDNDMLKARPHIHQHLVNSGNFADEAGFNELCGETKFQLVVGLVKKCQDNMDFVVTEKYTASGGKCMVQRPTTESLCAFTKYALTPPPGY